MPKSSDRPTKPYKGKCDIPAILAARAAGQTHREIAAAAGVSHVMVGSILKRYLDDKHAVSAFVTHRADILANVQRQALSLQLDLIEDLQRDRLAGTLTPSQKSGLLHTLTVVHGTALDKERLERGQSSANISVMQQMLSGNVSTLYKREAVKLRSAAPSTSQPADSNPE